MNLTLTVPDTLPDVLQVSSGQFAALAKQAMAVKLFESGKLSSGQAALLCDQSRVEFLLTLPQWGVPQLCYPADELATDLANAWAWLKVVLAISGKAIVLNTSPTLALVAALGSLDLLGKVYQRVLFSNTVAQEIRQAGRLGFGVDAFESALKTGAPFELAELSQTVAPWLAAALDAGEASVIALALQANVPLVGIDELAGRRVARLNGLQVTGSLGILLKLKAASHVAEIAPCLARMRAQGIWLSANLQAQALLMAGENAWRRKRLINRHVSAPPPSARMTCYTYPY